MCPGTTNPVHAVDGNHIQQSLRSLPYTEIKIWGQTDTWMDVKVICPLFKEEGHNDK